MENGEIILYTAEDGSTTIRLRAEGETVWLTQADMTELFQTTKQNISLHIRNILIDGEQNESAVKEHLTTATDGKLYNKMLWAATNHTAPELIVERANPKLPNMGLKSWKGSRVRQQDVTIAKNYLDQPEIEELNQIVVMYLDYAENQAKRRKTVTMAEWEQKLDAFLTFNEKDLPYNSCERNVRAETMEGLVN